MATYNSISSSLLCLCILFSFPLMNGAQASQNHYLQLQLTNLLPSPACKSSTKVAGNGAALKVVHKHGPCSELGENKGNEPNLEEILVEDQARVDSIHSKLSWSLDQKASTSTKLPVGTGNYFVSVGLGTPKQDIALVFDTGSSLTLAQCSSSGTFNPAVSSSYTNISCNLPLCSSVVTATGNNPRCASSTCMYGIEYGDGSYSIGFLGKERLSLGTDALDNFYFGCGLENEGVFGRADGLMGLGQDKLSIVSQTASKYKQIFSYCLPSSSSTGFLSFGGAQSNSAEFTPLSKSSSDSFYYLDLVGITVGGQELSIPSYVFSTSGTIIDSSTIITRLPPAAYSALRSAFRAAMSRYPRTRGLSILDTCYDFSYYGTINVPKIKLTFNGGTELEIDPDGIFFANGAMQVCLAFAGNSDPTDKGIFGNTQQRNYEVVFDVGGREVGFAAGGCS